ncbi:ABC transporter ATP-binding protein [Serpentinicella alkaliphila]|uniref:Amino acid/amide ABC transporter ATP-binding protein 2 (HAAT family) n=1 Tax=Serpentinicella alkaliphila TaxID=1734049 RepID=A0A4R2TBP7_9FIRM|nr:ABC transporter ATP-binding protein [Serpentinicella alkaliphila]QUH25612.1 ABC transporter ATP-binding protein [Serpentinicella alkaliphila]TCP98394.1 amino acid/amide ABC transporter ATP-binding protein 2 (HAAT family) [Serpentinicella alkaliphila]
MLKVSNVEAFYGRIQALKGINLQIKEKEIVTLVGSNGAGKTTLLKTICGLIKPKSGSIIFDNKEITNMNPHEIVKLGLSMSPEGRQIFPKMTVEENLELGAYTRKEKNEIKESYEKMYSLFPRLYERRTQAAGTMSGGEQQMLAIGRALMSKPKLLLLDEPSLGLAPLLVEVIFELIKEINNQGTTILLIEQNARMALNIAHRGYVIETGKIVLEDEAYALLQSEAIKNAYLGAE